MDKNLCPVEMPGLMHDALWVRVRDRRNRHSIMALAAWIMRQGLHLRSKKGFELVRGSDKDSPDGLKERADIKSLGLTADMIRGAIKGLVEVNFLSKQAGQVLDWRVNFRKQARTPPCIYRLSEEFLGFWRKAKREALARISEAVVAAKAVAAQALASVKALHHSENPSSAFPSPPNRRVQNITPCSGDLTEGVDQTAPPIAQEPSTEPSPRGVHDTRTAAEKSAWAETEARWIAAGIMRPVRL